MNHTQFFTDSLAGVLAAALGAAGISLPVYGQIHDAEAPHNRIEVRCNGVDEIIPGNATARLDGSIVLLLHATVSAKEAERTAADVAAVLETALAPERWRKYPLPLPPAVQDAEYTAAPFIVLELCTAPAGAETAGQFYALAVDYRAYVQF